MNDGKNIFHLALPFNASANW